MHAGKLVTEVLVGVESITGLGWTDASEADVILDNARREIQLTWPRSNPFCSPFLVGLRDLVVVRESGSRLQSC
jgi:hypothetical protein